MRGKLTYRQSQYLTCFKRPNATLTCKVQHTNHFLRRRMCSSINTSGEFGIALIKSKGRGEHARILSSGDMSIIKTSSIARQQRDRRAPT